jgi:pimeloyl-ACP methyl ester carboxylesterase
VKSRRLLSLMSAAAAIVGLSLSMAGCAATEAITSTSSATAIPPQADFAELVDIGDGREIYMECSGEGSPTVVLVSGKGNGARDGWSEALDPADPVHQVSYDAVAVGQGDLQERESAVFPSVAKFTRVCAYSRPGTGLDGPATSTAVPQPHPIGNAVSDLHALLDAAGESGPYVVVGHSYGGLVATLFASTYPDDVAGLVMNDSVNEFITTTATPEELVDWNELNKVTDGTVEGVELALALEAMLAAPDLPDVPAVVLSADKPPDPAGMQGIIERFGPVPTFSEWLASVELLATSLDAKHITETNSGHNIEVYQPQLVAGAIEEVVDAVREGLPRVKD